MTIVADSLQDPARQAALTSYGILDTPAEASFDDIAGLAAQLCATPVALVSLVAGDRQWFKARVGFALCETDLDRSVCAHALVAPDLLVIPDLTSDERTCANPLVTGAPHLRFYAGAPLRTADGHVLGSLCVIDHTPRPDGLTALQQDNLRALAGQVMAQLELRRAMASRDQLLAEQLTMLRDHGTLRSTQAAVSNADGDLETIFDVLLAGVMQAVTAADAGTIELIDGDELEYRAVRGTLRDHLGFRVPLRGSLAGSCASGNHPLLIDDVFLDARITRNLAERLRLRSAILAPVERAGKVVGVLKLQSGRPGAFSSHDLEIVRLFATAVSAGLSEASAARSARAVSLSESRYRAIFDSARDFAIIATDRDGRITNWNNGASNILGWTAEEMLGETAERFFTPEDRAEERATHEMRQALATGQANDERWHLRKDGRRFWASGEMMPLLGDDGAHLGFLKIMRDRTDEHLTGVALRDAERRLERAQQAGAIGLFSLDLSDEMVSGTPEFCRLYGLEVGPAHPVSALVALVVPEDLPLLTSAESRRAGGAPKDVEYRIRRADTGALRWIARRADYEHDGDGRPVRLAGSVQDVTSRKEAELAARSNLRDLQLVADALPFLIAFIDTDYVYRFANGAYRDWFAVSGPEAVVGRNVRDLLSAEEFALRKPQFDRVFAGQEAQFDLPWPHLDGRPRLADIRYLPHRGADGGVDGLYVFVQDVTERRRAENRQASLLMLSDRLREVTTSPAISAAAGAVLGTAFDVTLVGYGTVDHLAETITVEEDWTARGIESLAGVTRFRDYGSYIDDLAKGVTVIVEDTETDPRTRTHAAALRNRGVRAFVNLPIIEHGRFVALLYVSHSAPRAWSDGELALVREVAERTRDVTERVRSENALRESETQFRVFAEAIPNQVWASRPDGYLYWFNEQVRRYSGVDLEALRGQAEWAALIHPADVPAAADAWARSLATGEIYETEFRIRDAEGVYRWFLARAEPVRAADDAITRWVGTNTDIDERRRQGDQLKHFAAVLEQQVEDRTRDRDRIWRLTTDIILVARFDTIMVAVNPAWTALLGWSAEDLIGTSYLDLIHPDDRPASTSATGALGNGAIIPRFENRYRHKDGTYRWVTWTAVPDDAYVHAVGRDVTAEREQADIRAALEEQLRQSQKMEAVGQLTGGIAHDFNNLLTGITGSLDLMSNRVAQGRFGDLERYVGAAQGAAKRAAALTHRLLAFSRRQTLDPKPTDTNRLVTGMEDLVRRTVGPSVEVDVVTAAGLWPTLVDPNQLENALLNLCINARDAMPDGGRITIETANRWIDERGGRERELAPGQYISLCVSDTGTGMPADVIAKAFDPFFTTKPLGQGTGLGLSMIYGFARQSSGQVRIYSHVGEGTMVCIYLPRHFGEADAAEGENDTTGAPRAGAGETVLVVDDEPTIRMLVTEVLEELGYAAIEAADGASGLKVLQSNARIDLLVTDVGLPGGVNGRQMADAARVGRPELKVLFITGFAENAVIGDGHLDPGMHVMTKPFAMDALAARIKTLITT